MGELWQMGAIELATAIRQQTTSSREVVEAHLARIDAVNPAVNAVTVTLADAARAAADAADTALARGDAVGPLHGLPFTVKETVDCAGSATTWGVTAFVAANPTEDAPAVHHLRAAGALPLARTNSPDFALRWHTENALRGATRNPWETGRTAGGSSGGEAAALATGMTPLGVGSDLGGSLRWPSCCCGTATLRPTLGRIPMATSIEPANAPLSMQLMAVQGPMARHVRDLRLALQIMSRPSARDPWYAAVPLLGEAIGPPVRVAVVEDPMGEPPHPDVAAGVRAAAEALADAGYAVEEARPPDVSTAVELWGRLVLAEVRRMWPLLEQLVSADAARFLGHTFDNIPPADHEGYAAGFTARQGLARAWSLFQADHPLVLGPVATDLPFEVGADLEGPEAVDGILRSLALTVTVNLLGLPAAAVPAGEAGGLPRGVQVIGARYREDLCLDAADAIEARLGVLTPIDPRT
jgi:amidase